MPGPTAAPWWRTHWPALALAVVAALIALWAHEAIFPALSWNRDEPVYLWHVELLRSGRLTAPDGGFPTLFHPWLSARGDGVLYTQYTLGWPLVLAAADLLAGTAAAALPLGAALAVAGTYALGIELYDDRRIATLGAGVLALSPILPVQGGVYLSYLFTLGLGLLAGALLLSGARRQRPVRQLWAGVLFGWIFLTRPYDAVLWGAAFAVCLLLRHRDRVVAAVPPLLRCAATGLPFVVAGLAYNRHVTGSWLEFPITAADPLDRFGFGERRLMPGFTVVDYDLPAALRASAKNAFLVPWFLFGSYAALGTAGAAVWSRRREPATAALLVLGAAFPLGYLVFWGNHLSSLASRISGPIYYVPLYAPVCLLVAALLVGWWPQRRAAVTVLAAVLVVVTVPLAVNRLALNREISLAQEPWRDSVEGIDEPALVVVAGTAPYLLYLNPFSANPPDLDGPVLYAADTGPELLDLLAAHPERTPYVQEASLPSQEIGPRERPRHPDVRVRPIEVVRGAVVELAIEAAPGTGIARLTVEGLGDPRSIELGAEGRAILRLTAGPESGGGAVPVSGPGTLVVTASQPTSGGDGWAPLVRHRIHVRVAAGAVEVLTPTATERLVQLDERRSEWWYARDVGELSVTARPVEQA